MNWGAIVAAVISALASDPALKSLEQELWTWILTKIAPPAPAKASAEEPDVPAMVAEFKQSKGI